MKVLIVSDIHSNPWALDAVLKDAGPVEHVLFAGDAVNYGPDPRSVIVRLQDLEAIAVRGNHDHAVAFVADPRASALKQALALAIRDWTRDQLDSGDHAWLARLPLQLTWEIGGLRVAMCHATPIDPLFDYRLAPDLPDPLVREIASVVDADVLVVGHTHVPVLRTVGQLTLINPGSAGQPLDGDPRAAYAQWQDGQVSLRRAAYDLDAAVSAIGRIPVQRELREELIQTLRHGRLADG